ncbi:DNA primase large subunit [Cristinia sonorae]|uniref:DNA primase large subunit n=1 Tax=Cristinia sonorae TaxID=1940300 RepID=A0A8K0UYA1_9AGAR|nr:DNA primase large subunit [Cristinia sonorae]
MYTNKEKARPRPAKAASGSGLVQTHSHLKYPHQLNFYDQPPVEDITLEEFETCALSRLRVLGEIESSFARNRSWDELVQITNKQCENHGLKLNASTAISQDLDGERRRDHVGHFVLRLAFCRSEELRRRFVKAEMTLFRVRYESMTDIDEKNQFLQSLELGWEAVTEKELAEYHEHLVAAATSKEVLELTKQKKERYYKVRWTRVPDLIEKRRVFLNAGMAWVPHREIASIIYQEFQTRLDKALQMTAKALPRLDEDTRIIPILDNLSQGFLAGVSSEWGNASSSGNGSEVTADMVDDIARKHYPACMRNLHDCLRRDRHLKHFGRLQYGLFLKACVLGLSIEEALLFWRKSFSNMQDDKFNKEYRYNIRHSYGLEGKRANYAAKSCQQILLSDQPGSSDNHGCPYRHFAPENLQSALLSMYSSQGLTSGDLPEIMHTVKNGHYHVACTRVFEITHSKQVSKGEGIGGGESVTHPNQYVTKSREMEARMQVKDEDVVMG